MFHPSAATDTLQGRAIQRINEVWGDENKHRGWDNYKNIGIPVCKKKYRPFVFQIHRTKTSSSSSTTTHSSGAAGGGGGLLEISVSRRYGCCSHSNLRKKVIEQHGERKGWEPFGQWSLRKAKDAAKKETQRLNSSLQWMNATMSTSSSTSSSFLNNSHTTTTSSFSDDDEENEPLCFLRNLTSTRSGHCKNKQQQQQQQQQQQLLLQPWQTLCANGTCSWKVRGKYDDICLEIEEERLKNGTSKVA